MLSQDKLQEIKEALDKTVVSQTIERLKNDPGAGKKLKEPLKNFRSLKAWPYRIIYQYSENDRAIFINIIQHRQSTYK